MDDLYNNSIESWQNTVRKAGELGIGWSDFLDMRIIDFDFYIEGYVKRQEEYLNNLQVLGHRLAGKISQAVWGSDEYNKEMDPILLHEETLEEKSKRLVIRTLMNKGVIK